MVTARCGFDSGVQGHGSDLLVQHGPTLFVDIGFDANFRPGAGAKPDLPLKGLRALVDTGATECCIDSSAAMHLALPVIDAARIFTPCRLLRVPDEIRAGDVVMVT